MEKRKPDQLSGGQRQRVALARSLARRPKVLLLDEPLAALDKKLRESTQGELMELQRRLGMTFIIVTHDQEEAMTMADRIGVMDAGRLRAGRDAARALRGAAIALGRRVRRRHQSVRRAASRARAGQVEDRDPRRRHHHRHRAAAAGDRGCRQRRGPARKDQDLAPRTGVRSGRLASRSTASRAWSPRSTISAVSPTYKVRLDNGAMVRCSMANTARLDIDAYHASQRVVAWFTPDDCVVLEQ